MIDPETERPASWLYSAGEWTKQQYKAIYAFYNRVWFLRVFHRPTTEIESVVYNTPEDVAPLLQQAKDKYSDFTRKVLGT